MKKVTLIVRQTEISRIFPNGFQLAFEGNVSVIDAIGAADKEIVNKCRKFPVEKRKSLLHMVYHPYENRFYKQVAIQAYVRSQLLNVREDPKTFLLDGTTIILVPHGGCQTDWEEPVE